jgi:hypothetical protein
VKETGSAHVELTSPNAETNCERLPALTILTILEILAIVVRWITMHGNRFQARVVVADTYIDCRCHRVCGALGSIMAAVEHGYNHNSIGI